MTFSEVWKQVPSLPEYEASSLGRVRRIPYTAEMPHGGLRTYGGKAWFGMWQQMSPQYGRFKIAFKGKNYKVSRMVCEAFHGPAPEGKRYVLHDDEDSRNNTPENVKWGTQKENLNAPGWIAYRRSCVGERSNRAKSKAKRLLSSPPLPPATLADRSA